MTITLREQLDSKLVRYRLDRVFVQTIENPSKTTVQKNDGSFGDVVKEGLYLRRVGDGTGSNISDGFDPADPVHLAYIAKIDAWMAKHARKARVNGIEKIGIKRPSARIPNWDHMDIGQIEAVVEAIKPDLLWAMEYELHRSEDLGGTRQEVVDLLEDINVNGYLSAIEESDQVPTL